MDDHCHVLFQLPPTVTMADAILLIKTSSSQWMGKRFSWQKGYGAFSVSGSNIPTVIRYITNQERHHRKMSFEQEFITLLERHGVEYDPKYVFG
jgi:REP element-mobilizing transposase RayT